MRLITKLIEWFAKYIPEDTALKKHTIQKEAVLRYARKHGIKSELEALNDLFQTDFDGDSRIHDTFCAWYNLLPKDEKEKAA